MSGSGEQISRNQVKSQSATQNQPNTNSRNALTNQNATTNPNTEANQNAGKNPNAITNPNAVPTQNPVINPNAVKNPNAITNPNAVATQNPVINPNAVKNPNAITNPNAVATQNPVINPNAVKNPNAITNPNAVATQNPVINPNAVQNPSVTTTPNAVATQNAVINPNAPTNPIAVATQNPVINPNAVKNPNSSTTPNAVATQNPVINPNAVQNPNAPTNPNAVATQNPVKNPNTVTNPNITANPNAMENPNTIPNQNAENNPRAVSNPNTMANQNAATNPNPITNPTVATQNTVTNPNSTTNPNPMANQNAANQNPITNPTVATQNAVTNPNSSTNPNTMANQNAATNPNAITNPTVATQNAVANPNSSTNPNTMANQNAAKNPNAIANPNIVATQNAVKNLNDMTNANRNPNTIKNLHPTQNQNTMENQNLTEQNALKNQKSIVKLNVMGKEDVILCDLCEEKPATHVCHNCKFIMCEPCLKIHRKLLKCESKDTIMLSEESDRCSEIVQAEKKVIDEKLQQLKTLFEDSVRHNDQAEREAIAGIHHYRNEIIQLCLEEEDRVKKIVTRTMQKNQDDYDNCVSTFQQLNRKFSNEDVKSKSMVWVKSCNAFVMRLDYEIGQIKFPHFNVRRPLFINRFVEKDRAIHVTLTRDLGISNISLAKSRLALPAVKDKKSPRVNFRANLHQGSIDWAMKQLSVKQLVDLTGYVLKMLIIEGDLWCLMNNHIEIYDPNTGQLIKAITKEFRGAHGMALTSTGSLILACVSGLVQLDTTGHRIRTIAPGDHRNVSAVGECFIALRKKADIVYMDKYDGHMHKIHDMATQVKYDRDVMTCVEVEKSLYICSSGRNCIYKVAQTGRIVASFGIQGSAEPGELHSPIVCCAESNLLIVADSHNHRIQLFDCAEKIWSVVKTQGEIHFPIAAAADETGKLFVIGGLAPGPCTLHVFTIAESSR